MSPINREGCRIPGVPIDAHEIGSVKEWQQVYIEETTFWQWFHLLNIAYGIPMVHKVTAMH